MAKANYYIKETKDKYEMSYSGDLREATEKARKDLDKALHDGTIVHWVFIKTMAEKAIKANSRKIQRLQVFIETAEKQLRKEEKND